MVSCSMPIAQSPVSHQKDRDEFVITVSACDLHPLDTDTDTDTDTDAALVLVLAALPNQSL
jgi:hypothetical protein